MSFDSACVDIDVETDGLQWYANKMFMAQSLSPRSPAELDNVYVDEVAPTFPRFQEALDYAERNNIGIRAHNGKFDFHFAKASGLYLPPDHLWHDSETLVKLVDERKSAALKAVGDRVFGAGESDLQDRIQETLHVLRTAERATAKANGTDMVWPSYRTVWQADRELMRQYAAYDVVLQRRIAEHYQPLIARDEKLRWLYELERDTMVALFWAEDRGVPVDREAMRRFEVALLDQYGRLFEKLQALAGIKTFNPNSPKQVGEALERRGANIAAMGTTKTGQIKTENEDLVAANDELALTMLDFRTVDKTLNTYVRPALHTTEWDGGKGPRAPYLTSDDRIHADFRTWGARTGRMSCATPNMQNIPRDDLSLRYTWAARDGNVLVTADMDQIELRLLAAYAGEGRFLDAFKRGDDVHAQTARDLDLVDLRRAGGRIEQARDRGKRFNYQVTYGAGIRSIKKYHLTDSAGARRMLDQFKNAYPEIENLQNRITYQLAENGFIRTRYGRKQRRDDVAWDVSYKYLNYLLQGSAGDMIKIATRRVHQAGVPIVAVIHDEIIADVPREDAAEAAKIIRDALTDFPEVTDHVPLDADAKIVDRWSDAKQAGFDPDYMETQ